MSGPIEPALSPDDANAMSCVRLWESPLATEPTKKRATPTSNRFAAQVGQLAEDGNRDRRRKQVARRYPPVETNTAELKTTVGIAVATTVARAQT